MGKLLAIGPAAVADGAGCLTVGAVLGQTLNSLYWLADCPAAVFVSRYSFGWRGVDTQPQQRWRIACQRFTRPMQLAVALSAIAAVSLGGLIFYNTLIVNAGPSQAEEQTQLIAYETAYGALRDAQPKITAINLQGDLYPEEDSRFAVKGTYTLENQTDQAIDTILGRVLKARQSLILSYEKSRVVVGFKTDPSSIGHLSPKLTHGPKSSPPITLIRRIPMARKIVNGLQLTKQCWQALRQNPQLMIFPLLSGLALLLVGVAFAIPTVAGGLLLSGGQIPTEEEITTAEWVFLTVMAFLFYFVCYTVIIFSNTALVGVSMKLLQGDKATVGDGIAIAMGRLGQILGFALISATIGTLAQAGRNAGQDSKNGIAGILAAVVGSLVQGVWIVVVFFAIPIYVVENVGPIAAIRRSWELFKQTWGEGFTGRAAISGGELPGAVAAGPHYCGCGGGGHCLRFRAPDHSGGAAGDCGL